MPVIDSSPLALKRSGLVEYEEALAIQRTIHSEVAAGVRPNTLILLEHPSIYTAGKRTLDEERPGNGARVLDVDRGGKITWHGPGQLVGYPIVRLSNPHELVGFVREIEAGLIKVCADFGITGVRVAGRSGVWIVDEKGERKVAAIGIRVASGTSMHGFALNVNPDLSAFEAIVPCGISDAAVTSLAQELGREITIAEVTPVVEKYLYEALTKVSA
ncbi:LipB Lipoate-protein ligase B [Candidatus Nanopelagicaceae bacterium]